MRREMGRMGRVLAGALAFLGSEPIAHGPGSHPSETVAQAASVSAADHAGRGRYGSRVSAAEKLSQLAAHMQSLEAAALATRDQASDAGIAAEVEIMDMQKLADELQDRLEGRIRTDCRGNNCVFYNFETGAEMMRVSMADDGEVTAALQSEKVGEDGRLVHRRESEKLSPGPSQVDHLEHDLKRMLGRDEEAVALNHPSGNVSPFGEEVGGDAEPESEGAPSEAPEEEIQPEPEVADATGAGEQEKP